MSLTLLLDLDDTLLVNTASVFIPAYINLLTEYLGEKLSNQNIQPALLSAVKQMSENTDPAKTLEECFDSRFYPKINTSKEFLQHAIEEFYGQVYPQLRGLTRQQPQANLLTRELSARLIPMVVATNPLFPKTAISQRIAWADLYPKEEDYALITSFEAFHFAKPNPSCYAEILAKLGWPETFVAMVGNDWNADIVPAETVGIPTFFLGEQVQQQDFERHPGSSQGNWNDLQNWVQKLYLIDEPFEPKNSIQAYLAVLASTAAFIDSFFREHQSLDLWRIRPSTEEWSLVEILSHIADVDEEVNLPRICAIQKEEMPFFPAALTDEWAAERHYILNDPFKEVNRFIENRKKLIENISNLNSQDLSKLVNHAIFGPTSVLEIIKIITQHDRIHIRQMIQTTSPITKI
jgi:FMN phosphatase YigB (HAD superfamily)